ncbi:hypothetical protein [Pedobacter xixiisoli]|uniref:Lipoprotein n=1 Tax=Pedobacter xixiisoli TaxID=1476464 RepID=A0A285ZYX2_9SPHI|nr:hypothetical protein [Pedobacter xixiisoli]SOD14850.1 hypothetical protein SAMN06297358_1809 [Pedobacter xixiisoli]
MANRLITLSYIIIVISFLSCSENKIYYDIPPLIGKDIDEAREILKDQEDRERPFRKSISHKQDNYTIDGRILIIKFDPITRKITQIDLVYPKGYSDKSEILKIGNLKEETENYKCEVSTDDWTLSPFTSYNGVTIMPIH